MFAFICSGIFINFVWIFLKKVGACVFGTPVFFLSLLAGKLRHIEQSARVTLFTEIFKRSKKQITQRQRALNQRMCRRHKVRLSFFFSTSTLYRFFQIKGGETFFFSLWLFINLSKLQEEISIKSRLHYRLCFIRLDREHNTASECKSDDSRLVSSLPAPFV